MEKSEPRMKAETFDVFQALSSPRRRMILELAHEHDSTSLTEFATEIAAHENQTPTEAVTGEEYKRVYVSLYQTHLPKLHDGGYIEYDQQSGDVTPRDWTKGLLPLIEGLRQLDQDRAYESEEAPPGIGLLGRYRLTVSKEGDA